MMQHGDTNCRYTCAKKCQIQTNFTPLSPNKGIMPIYYNPKASCRKYRYCELPALNLISWIFFGDNGGTSYFSPEFSQKIEDFLLAENITIQLKNTK